MNRFKILQGVIPLTYGSTEKVMLCLLDTLGPDNYATAEEILHSPRLLHMLSTLDLKFHYKEISADLMPTNKPFLGIVIDSVSDSFITKVSFYDKVEEAMREIPLTINSKIMNRLINPKLNSDTSDIFELLSDFMSDVVYKDIVDFYNCEDIKLADRLTAKKMYVERFKQLFKNSTYNIIKGYIKDMDTPSIEYYYSCGDEFLGPVSTQLITDCLYNLLSSYFELYPEEKLNALLIKDDTESLCKLTDKIISMIDNPDIAPNSLKEMFEFANVQMFDGDFTDEDISEDYADFSKVPEEIREVDRLCGLGTLIASYANSCTGEMLCKLNSYFMKCCEDKEGFNGAIYKPASVLLTTFNSKFLVPLPSICDKPSVVITNQNTPLSLKLPSFTSLVANKYSQDDNISSNAIDVDWKTVLDKDRLSSIEFSNKTNYFSDASSGMYENINKYSTSRDIKDSYEISMSIPNTNCLSMYSSLFPEGDNPLKDILNPAELVTKFYDVHSIIDSYSKPEFFKPGYTREDMIGYISNNVESIDNIEEPFRKILHLYIDVALTISKCAISEQAFNSVLSHCYHSEVLDEYLRQLCEYALGINYVHTGISSNDVNTESDDNSDSNNDDFGTDLLVKFGSIVIGSDGLPIFQSLHFPDDTSVNNFTRNLYRQIPFLNRGIEPIKLYLSNHVSSSYSWADTFIQLMRWGHNRPTNLNIAGRDGMYLSLSTFTPTSFNGDVQALKPVLNEKYNSNKYIDKIITSKYTSPELNQILKQLNIPLTNLPLRGDVPVGVVVREEYFTGNVDKPSECISFYKAYDIFQFIRCYSSPNCGLVYLKYDGTKFISELPSLAKFCETTEFETRTLVANSLSQLSDLPSLMKYWKELLTDYENKLSNSDITTYSAYEFCSSLDPNSDFLKLFTTFSSYIKSYLSSILYQITSDRNTADIDTSVVNIPQQTILDLPDIVDAYLSLFKQIAVSYDFCNATFELALESIDAFLDYIYSNLQSMIEIVSVVNIVNALSSTDLPAVTSTDVVELKKQYNSRFTNSSLYLDDKLYLLPALKKLGNLKRWIPAGRGFDVGTGVVTKNKSSDMECHILYKMLSKIFTLYSNYSESKEVSKSFDITAFLNASIVASKVPLVSEFEASVKSNDSRFIILTKILTLKKANGQYVLQALESFQVKSPKDNIPLFYVFYLNYAKQGKSYTNMIFVLAKDYDEFISFCQSIRGDTVKTSFKGSMNISDELLGYMKEFCSRQSLDSLTCCYSSTADCQEFYKNYIK